MKFVIIRSYGRSEMFNYPLSLHSNGRILHIVYQDEIHILDRTFFWPWKVEIAARAGTIPDDEVMW